MSFLKLRRFQASLTKGWSFYNDPPPGDPPPPPPAPTPPPPPAPTPPGKAFTQADVDRFLAEDRRKHQARQTQLAQQLEQLQSSERLTKEEKEALAAQVEELKNASLTKEQQLTRDLEKARAAEKAVAESLTKERDDWQQRYGTLLVTNKITEAAGKHEAFSITQIKDILFPRAKVVEKKGEDGKGLGEFDVVIKFEDTDAKTKQPVVLELNPDAVVARMKELPERFGNLFKSGVQGGVGKTKTGTSADEPDVSKMTAAEYREYRKTRKL